MQAAAAVAVVDQFGGFGEGVGGGLLYRGGGAGPDLAGHAQEPAAHAVADLGVGQAQHTDAPAAQGEVLAQPGGDDGALGREVGGAVHPHFVVVGVDQIAVDLVGDDEQVELAGDLGQAAHGLLACDGPGRVVGHGDHDGVDGAALVAGVGDGGVQQVGLGDPALPGGGGNHDGAAADQTALGGVTDPAGGGDRGVPAQFQEQAVEQRLAAGTGDDHGRVGGQAAAFPVTGGGLAQGRGPGDGAVGVGAVARGELVAHDRVDRESGLTEAERKHAHPLAAFLLKGFVHGEGRGHSDGHV